LRIDQVLVYLLRVLKRLLYRAFGDLIEHHAKRGFGRLLRHDLFSQVLANCFAFTIRVSGQVDRIGFFRRLFQIGNNLFVVALFRVGDDLVLGLEVILDIDPQTFGRQIFDMPDRGLHDEVLAEIFIDRFRLGRRFDNYEILCHLPSLPVTH
jgi:hypothetical protein